jgi:hypothetical protein
MVVAEGSLASSRQAENQGSLLPRTAVMKSPIIAVREALPHDMVLRSMLPTFAGTEASPVVSRASSPFPPWMTSGSSLSYGGVSDCGGPSMSACTAALMDLYLSQVMRTNSLARSIYELGQRTAAAKNRHAAYPIKRAVQTKFSYGAGLHRPHGVGRSSARRSDTSVCPGMKPLGPPPQLPKLAPWRKLPEEQPSQQAPSKR